jgi:pantetheine-phosphate adenylyltransferase
MVHENPSESRAVRAVYPGTFDPFTPGHLDVAERARRLFDHLTILVAVNQAKSPERTELERAAAIRGHLPEFWSNVTVAAWSGLTAEYCRLNAASVIVRGIRHATDARHECELAAMNETFGLVTLLVPARAELAAVSSTAVRSVGSVSLSGPGKE